MNASGMCCPEIVKAGADIDALEDWRAEHEVREKDNFNLLMNQLIAIQAEQAELRKMLANRLPGWATFVLTMAGGTIGLLVGIILELSRRL